MPRFMGFVRMEEGIGAPPNWGYENEGSSDIPSSETYRGPALDHLLN